MGVSLVITSANVTEIPYMEVLKIVVSAMFGFCRFIRQYWSCMLPCVPDELLFQVTILCLLIYKLNYFCTHIVNAYFVFNPSGHHHFISNNIQLIFCWIAACVDHL